MISLPTPANPPSTSLAHLLPRAAAACGAAVREAAERDMPHIVGIARASFPVPAGWVDRRAAAGLYRCQPRRENAFGSLHTLVVAPVPGGRPAAYGLFQRRHDGDLYILELAARPPAPEARVAGAGTLLLAGLLALPGLSAPSAAAASARCRVTANVSAFYRATYTPRFFARTWDDPLPFYLKLGFGAHERCRQGYTHDGAPRDPADTWLDTPLADLRSVLQARLAMLAAGAHGPDTSGAPQEGEHHGTARPAQAQAEEQEVQGAQALHDPAWLQHRRVRCDGEGV